jgi:hypothetical protein
MFGVMKHISGPTGRWGSLTAYKVNNLKPYSRYLRYLFEKLSFASSEEELKNLLPMYPA